MTFRSRVLRMFVGRDSNKKAIAKQRRSIHQRKRALFLEGLEGRQLLAAEVNVLGNATTIVDGATSPSTSDHTQFNSTLVGATSTRTYTIQNTGDSDLTLSNPTSSSARFAIQNFPAGPITAGGSATFDVVFTPNAGSNVTGTISFDNNDSDENPYNFDVLGPGVTNLAPVFGQGSYGVSLAENSANNTNVIFDPAISATDGNSGIGDTITYSIVAGNGTGSGAFKINSATGQIQVNDSTQLDYEKTSGFSLTIRATDSVGAFGSATANIFMFQVPEPPVITPSQQFSIPENSAVATTVGTVLTTFDAVSVLATRSFSIIGGNTGTAFAISNTGVLTVANTGPLDFETVPGQKFTLTVRASDSEGDDDETVIVNLTNVNEAPTNIALAPTSVAENQPSGTTVGTLSTTDVDAGDTFTYSLVGGTGSTDNASFTIAGNELKTAAGFNFEVKNIYSVRIRTQDFGGLAFEKAFTVTVTNVNDAPTLISLSANEIEENKPIGTAIGVFSSTDEDAGETFSYSLVPGSGAGDNGFFSIVGNQLQSNAVFDYESDNAYSIRVRTTDSGLLFKESIFIIHILNSGEAPTDIGLSISSIAENNSVGAPIGVLTTTDVDPLDTFTYALVVGDGADDNASFTIDGDTLKAAEAFNFETKSSYTVRVRSTDPEGLFVEKAFSISVIDSAEGPTAISISNSSVVEEEPIGATVGALNTTDPDIGETFTYTLVSGTGSDDNASFTIAGAELKSAAIFDYQTKNSYTVRVRSTDSDGLFTEQAFTISISDVRISGISTAAAINYKENAVPALISSAGTVADVQLLDFAGGTLTASLAANGSVDDRLSIKHAAPAANKVSVDFNTSAISFTKKVGTVLVTSPIGTFTGGVGTTPLVITFNANAFKAEVQAVLRVLTFSNVSESPSTAARTVRFVITDGDGGISNTQTRTVNVITVNDKPVVTTSGSSVVFNEAGLPVIIDTGVVISDVDSADFSTGKLTVKAASGGQSSDRFGIAPGGMISVSGTTVNYNSVPLGTFAGTTTLTVTLNSTATPAKVQELARHIVFSNISAAPSTATRGISFSVSDGDGGTSLAALGDTVDISIINDAPVLTLTNTTSAKYAENAVPLLIATTATVVDVDLLDFNTGTLTVALTGNGTAEDSLGVKSVGTDANQVSVSGNTISFTDSLLATYAVATCTGGDGTNPLVITFNTFAYKTEVQAVMKAITFANSSDSPSTAQRTVSFTLTDGDGATSNTVIRSIDITLKNDAPVVAIGGDLDYTILDPAILIADSATVSDVDSDDFNGGKLTVALGTGKNAADRIAIQDGNDITALAGVVSDGVNVIGTYSGTTTLIITFNSAFATPTAVQKLLRQITFKADVVGTSITRALTVTLTDGDGGTSTPVAKTISVHNLIA